MKIDAETLKNRSFSIFRIFCFFWYLPSWARRCVWLLEQTLPKKLLGLSEGFALAFQNMWPGRQWTG